MKIVPILFIFLFVGVFCREIYYEELDYWPKDASKIIDYETVKLTRSKNKTLIYFKGNFSILENLGNEKLVFLELYNRDALMMVRAAKPFCEFIKGETIFWPALTKASNMPKDSPCPYPAGNYTINKFSIPFSKSLVQPLGNGVYTMNIIVQEAGKDVLKFTIKFSVKRS